MRDGESCRFTNSQQLRTTQGERDVWQGQDLGAVHGVLACTTKQRVRGEKGWYGADSVVQQPSDSKTPRGAQTSRQTHIPLAKGVAPTKAARATTSAVGPASRLVPVSSTAEVAVVAAGRASNNAGTGVSQGKGCAAA